MPLIVKKNKNTSDGRDGEGGQVSTSHPHCSVTREPAAGHVNNAVWDIEAERSQPCCKSTETSFCNKCLLQTAAFVLPNSAAPTNIVIKPMTFQYIPSPHPIHHDTTPRQHMDTHCFIETQYKTKVTRNGATLLWYKNLKTKKN